jgi:hypothetical protein
MSSCCRVSDPRRSDVSPTALEPEGISVPYRIMTLPDLLQ